MIVLFLGLFDIGLGVQLRWAASVVLGGSVLVPVVSVVSLLNYRIHSDRESGHPWSCSHLTANIEQRFLLELSWLAVFVFGLP